MRGLLLKDIYVLRKNARIIFFLVALFALLPGRWMTTLAFVYSVMMPMYAMSFDERSKWERMAAAMPYGRRTVVVSRYVLGLICVMVVMGVALVGRAVNQMVTGAPIDFMELFSLCMLGLLFQAFVMPFLVKLGTEKGRMAYIGGIVLLTSASFVLDSIEQASGVVNAIASAINRYALLLVALVAALNALSLALSIRWYKTRSL